jgi:hypothetical protein
MPKRTDIHSILIIGAGPIVIGQACEFDYSGAQACKALREEGFRVILVNSNPATIMTDPEMADATYIEPITWRTVERIIEVERRMRCCRRWAGRRRSTAPWTWPARACSSEHGVEMIGATARRSTRPRTATCSARRCAHRPRYAARGPGPQHGGGAAGTGAIGFPCIIRPSFTMGGSGGGIAYNREEFEEICLRGLDLSPTSELLIEESLLGWKEYEMEVVRDRNDNCIIVCSIENFDAMGVHTGDSITVAPAQTLTDKEYQIMRDASLAVLREIGVDTGGSNVQFAINPADGPHGRHRDEPARVALLGAGLEGHGLPDRQGRGQARRRLHARRAAQRHHRRRHAGVLRAVDRLRRHQGAAVRLREVPAGRCAPDHADEVRRRGHGDRPHLPGIPAEGPARPRDRLRARSACWRTSRSRPTSSSPSCIQPGAERIWYLADAFRVG